MAKNKKTKIDKGLMWCFSILAGLLLLYFIYNLFTKEEYTESSCTDYEDSNYNCTQNGASSLFNKYKSQITQWYCASPSNFNNNFSSQYDTNIGCYGCKTMVKNDFTNYLNSLPSGTNICTGSGGGGGLDPCGCDDPLVKSSGGYCSCLASDKTGSCKPDPNISCSI